MNTDQLAAWHLACTFAIALNRHIKVGYIVKHAGIPCQFTEPVTIDDVAHTIEWEQGEFQATLYDPASGDSCDDVRTYWTTSFTVAVPLNPWY